MTKTDKEFFIDTYNNIHLKYDKLEGYCVILDNVINYTDFTGDKAINNFIQNILDKNFKNGEDYINISISDAKVSASPIGEAETCKIFSSVLEETILDLQNLISNNNYSNVKKFKENIDYVVLDKFSTEIVLVKKNLKPIIATSSNLGGRPKKYIFINSFIYLYNIIFLNILYINFLTSTIFDFIFFIKIF